MACGAFAGYGHSSSYVHIDHLSHGLGSYDGGYDHYDDHDYHVSSLTQSSKVHQINTHFERTHSSLFGGYFLELNEMLRNFGKEWEEFTFAYIYWWYKI